MLMAPQTTRTRRFLDRSIDPSTVGVLELVLVSDVSNAVMFYRVECTD